MNILGTCLMIHASPARVHEDRFRAKMVAAEIILF